MDPTLTGKMPADLLVGEDGYPRQYVFHLKLKAISKGVLK